MKKQIASLSVVAIALLPGAALAEDVLRADTPQLDTRTVPKKAPLSGKVSVDHTHHEASKPSTPAAPIASVKPVKPAAPPPQTAVNVAPQRPAPPNFPPPPSQNPPMNGMANMFGGMPMRGTMDKHALRAFLASQNPYALRAQQQMQQQMQQAQGQKRWTNPDDAPYRWGQCPQGGYGDMSGTYKGPPVWGDKLAQFGGRFYDGTPVPKGPVNVNSYGHIWWQNQLSGNFVRKDDLRKMGVPGL